MCLFILSQDIKHNITEKRIITRLSHRIFYMKMNIAQPENYLSVRIINDLSIRFVNHVLVFIYFCILSIWFSCKTILFSRLWFNLIDFLRTFYYFDGSNTYCFDPNYFPKKKTSSILTYRKVVHSIHFRTRAPNRYQLIDLLFYDTKI